MPIDPARLRIARTLRVATRPYPFRSVSPWFNRQIGRLGMDDATPCWAQGSSCGAPVPLALNVANRYQRLMYLFPDAWARFYRSRPLWRLMADRLSPGATFIDIGASLGIFALRATDLVGPAGCVLAFEPEPDTCESLRRTAAANRLDQLQVFEVALSDRDARLPFHRDWYGGSSSLVPSPREPWRYRDTVDVSSRTLDAVVEQHGMRLDRVGLVKIDVEGAEARVLAGMVNTIEAAGRPPLWVEVRGVAGSRRAPNTCEPVVRCLAAFGYEPFQWRAGRIARVTPVEVRGRTDLLFCSS